jgi:hypothetical protein
MVRKERLQDLRRRYQLGDSRAFEESADELLSKMQIRLADADRKRLLRKLMQVEIKALEDIIASNEATFDGIVASLETAPPCEH